MGILKSTVSDIPVLKVANSSIFEAYGPAKKDKFCTDMLEGMEMDQGALSQLVFKDKATFRLRCSMNRYNVRI